MKLLGRTRIKFRLIILLVLMVFIFILSYVFKIESLQMAKEVSRDYAQLYASEVEKSIQAQLMREIALVQEAADSKYVREWLKNENDSNARIGAFEELIADNQLLSSHNISVTVAESKHCYRVNAFSQFSNFIPERTLDANIIGDKWYFETMSRVTGSYDLNMSSDQFVKNMRLWINVKVVDKGKVLGNIGTGLEVEPFVEAIFSERQSKDVKIFLIDELGAIQIDSDIENIKLDSFTPNEEGQKTIFKYFKQDLYKNMTKAYLADAKEPLLLVLEDNPYEFAALRSIKGTDWHVAVLFSVNSLLERYDLKMLYGFMLVMLLGLAILLNRVSNRLFMIPLEKLNESIKSLKEEPAKQFYGIERDDEYGTLARTIQDMKDRLNDYSKDLEIEVKKHSRDLQEALNRIGNNERRLERMFMDLPVGVFRINSNFELVYCNDIFKEQFETDSEVLLKEWLSQGISIAFADQDSYNETMEKLSTQPEDLAIEIKLSGRKGKTFWADVRLNKVVEGDDYFYDGTLINIESQKEVEKNLITLINIDQLTGIYNRHYFDTVLVGEVNRSERYEESLSMVIFDLDFFKGVNDTYGHDKGDEVLKRTAEEALKSVRKSDILVRWGGEEFAVLMPHTNRNGAVKVAEKIRQALEILEHPGVGRVTASFGVAEHLAGETTHDWFVRADKAMFTAKNSGRNCVKACEAMELSQTSFIKLIWKKEFESGEPRIDEQHKALFHLANQLKDMSLLGKDLEKEMAMFEKIIQHILVHFRTEEEVLKEYGYIDLEAHHQIHQDLAEQIIEAKKDFEEGKITVSDIFTFLIDEVIAEHLFHEDAKFFEHIQKE